MHCKNEIKERFLLGEKRWLEYKVSPCGTAPQHFAILGARYELKRLYEEGNVVEGNCLVDEEEKTIRCLLEPMEKGNYLMTITFSIAEEIFKEKVQIEVC